MVSSADPVITTGGVNEKKIEYCRYEAQAKNYKLLQEWSNGKQQYIILAGFVV